jgi:hypothetical protein
MNVAKKPLVLLARFGCRHVGRIAIRCEKFAATCDAKHRRNLDPLRAQGRHCFEWESKIVTHPESIRVHVKGKNVLQ